MEEQGDIKIIEERMEDDVRWWCTTCLKSWRRECDWIVSGGQLHKWDKRGTKEWKCVESVDFEFNQEEVTGGMGDGQRDEGARWARQRIGKYGTLDVLLHVCRTTFHPLFFLFLFSRSLVCNYGPTLNTVLPSVTPFQDPLFFWKTTEMRGATPCLPCERKWPFVSASSHDMQ